MHPMLNIAVKAARRAGSVINRAVLEGGLEVRAKNRNDFVTQVDRAAEQAVIDVIRRAYPDHGFMAEESGTTAADPVPALVPAVEESAPPARTPVARLDSLGTRH